MQQTGVIRRSGVGRPVIVIGVAPGNERRAVCPFLVVPISVGLRRTALTRVVTAPAVSKLSASLSTAALVIRAKCCDNGIVPPAPALDHCERRHQHHHDHHRRHDHRRRRCRCRSSAPRTRPFRCRRAAKPKMQRSTCVARRIITNCSNKGERETVLELT